MKSEKILIIAPVYNGEDVIEHFFHLDVVNFSIIGFRKMDD